MHRYVSTAIRGAISRLLPLVDRAAASDGHPFDEPDVLRPLVNSRRYGWTHYGVMIPDLPEPHRYFTVMSLIGATGSIAFDTDHARAAPPRRNASVVTGTAATHPNLFANHAIGDGFDSRPDGSLVRFGDELTIAGRYPDFHLNGTIGDTTIDLQLTASGTVTWFFRSPVYKHLSLLTDYRGTITGPDATPTAVDGICAFEYGACPSPHTLWSRTLPDSVKAPLDLFVYQIVNLDADSQILLSHFAIGGQTLMATAQFRTRGGLSTRFADVTFEIVETRAEPEPTPYGIPMPVPASTRFTVRGPDGDEWLDLVARMDSPWTYGLGSGFVTGFHYSAIWQGGDIDGRGYLEFIDRRSR